MADQSQQNKPFAYAAPPAMPLFNIPPPVATAPLPAFPGLAAPLFPVAGAPVAGAAAAPLFTPTPLPAYQPAPLPTLPAFTMPALASGAPLAAAPLAAAPLAAAPLAAPLAMPPPPVQPAAAAPYQPAPAPQFAVPPPVAQPAVAAPLPPTPPVAAAMPPPLPPPAAPAAGSPSVVQQPPAVGHFQPPPQSPVTPGPFSATNGSGFGSGAAAAAARQPDTPGGAAAAQSGSFAQQPGGAATTGRGTPTTANAPSGKRSRPVPQSSRRIDPLQVPSPCRDLPPDTAGASRPRYQTSRGQAPLSLTGFVAVDDGNASPKFIRPTLQSAPHEQAFATEAGVPFAAVLSPLCPPLEAEEAVPVVSGRAPVRCKRCRAYVNAYAAFTQLGRNWVCNFCEMSNEVATDYFCNLDANGRRRDAPEKAELSRGSVEFDVDGFAEYQAKNEKGVAVAAAPENHLFVLDVSRGARTTLPALVAALRATLRQMAAQSPRCRVSFITFASTLHFYNFAHEQMPQLVVPDVEQPFVPLPFNLLCWMALATDLERVEAFLDRLPQLCADADEEESAVGAAVKAASLILSDAGGKVVLTAHKAPLIGVGKFRPREQHKIYGTEKEAELLKPIDGFWPAMAVECAKAQISVDTLVFPTEYCELVTLGQLAHLTNGAQHLFVNFSERTDALRLHAAVAQSLLEEQGYAGILRVRCSNGLCVKGYRGHYLSQSAQDMDLASVSGSSTFLVDLSFEGKLDPKGYAYLQAALLYTTRNGSRRVRVHTLRLAVSNSYSALYRNCDLEACTFATAQDCIGDAVNKGPKKARELAIERLVKMLTAYRRHCSAGSHSGQLLMPEQLKLLPIYTLCLLKSDALAVGTSVRIDERVQCIHDLMTMPVHRLLHFLYPRMYAIHGVANHPTAGTISATSGQCHLPTMQQLTADVVMSHGAYLLHDQQARLVYLWLGGQLSPRVSQQLFGCDDASATLPSLGPDAALAQCSERVRNVVEAVMRRENGSRDRLLVVREHDPAEEAFFRCMLEDESVPGAQSYSDLLCYLHKQINTRLS